MAFIDYYKILGVDRNIPQKDVRAAYRKRAKLFHPYLHPNDPKAKAKFQALNEAYEVIGDPDKRAKYDQYGEKWREADAFQGGAGGFGGGGAGGGNPFGGFDFSQFSGSGGGGFSSFFQDLFGGRSQGRTMYWGSAAPRPDEGEHRPLHGLAGRRHHHPFAVGQQTPSEVETRHAEWHEGKTSWQGQPPIRRHDGRSDHHLQYQVARPSDA